MATSTDYAGRTFDVLAFDAPIGQGEALVATELAATGEGGRIVSGIAKLAQRVLMKLLTVRGSMAYADGEGTDFLGRFHRGEIRTQLDAEQAFQSAAVDIQRQLALEVTDDQPLDEQLKDIRILSVIYMSTTVVFRFRLTSLDGSAILLLPLSTALLGAN